MSKGYPQDVNELLPFIALQIKASPTSSAALYLLGACGVQILGQWNNMEEVIKKLLSHINNEDRVIGVLAILNLGILDKFIEREQLKFEIIATLNKVASNVKAEDKPLSISCGIALAQLGAPEALLWATAQMNKMKDCPNLDHYFARAKQSVLHLIIVEKWH